ncbi:MAG TPA: DUF4097 family beta strand repeat-containing protein [Anaerolineae bacterium]|nr:DUF4097 family beta strand repeat-containing protein [Anaerolineae bacterium]
MNRLQFDVSEGTRVELLRVDNDAVVQGGEAGSVEILLDGDEEQVTVQQEEGSLRIESQVALSVRVPESASVNVTEVNGDLILRDLHGHTSVQAVHNQLLVQSCRGPVTLDTVHGDLTVDGASGPVTASQAHGDVRLNQVSAPVQLGSVQGDVRARSLAAPLQMGKVSGDVRVRDARGQVTLEDGAGDVKGTELVGGMQLHHIKGDLILKTSLTAGATYRARADGDIVARFPEDSSARFVLEAGGPLLAKLPEVEEEGAGRLVGRVGDGAATVELRAGGSLSVKIRGAAETRPPFGVDLGEDLAAQIEAQIAESLGAFDVDGVAQREIEKAMRKAEREIERARERAEHDRERAEERLRRAQEKAAEAARRAQERIARHRPPHVGLFGKDVNVDLGARHRSQRPKVSDEEQLTILRMVQEGKISIEEAEKLLKALEK